VAAFGGLNKFKMAAVAMVTKVHLFIFESLTIYFDFILAAILKTLSDDLFLCQVSKGSAVGSEFCAVKG
jgi:hypothetical protein